MPQSTDSRAAKSAIAHRGGPRTFELLRAKLDVPPPRAGLVERSGVIDRLSRRRTGRFVSIVAPPGYGKTTALGQWAASDGRAFAWVSLDHRDNDPVVLLSYIAEALNADGGIKAETFKALTGAGDSLWARGLPRLGAALAARSTPVVLVLDDIHELVNDACLDALAALVTHVPHGSVFVLSGRTEARLGLPRLRAEGELLELGPASLALNGVEAHALLTAAGVDVSEQQANTLNQHVEGWAAGLYLAALWLDGADASSLDSFGGDDRFVTDYLRAEHLARITPEQVEFLTRTSMLDRLSGPVCDAVLERRDSESMLEAVEAANLFLIPLDHRRQWFRYHHLFRQMLTGELRRREPELVPTLHRRAAAWWEANGDPEASIESWAAAGYFDDLARVFTTLAFPYYRTGRVTTLERWLELFGEHQLERYPAVAVFGVWLHALRGRPEAAERWALAVESSDATAPMPDGSPSAAWAATVRALLCRRGVAQMQQDAEAAVAGLSAASPWRGVALLLRGVAVLLSGDAAAAEPMFVEAAEASEGSGAIYAGVVARSQLALLALERGDLSSAAADVALASSLVEGAPSTDYVVTGILLATTARLALAQGQAARARQLLVSAQRVRPHLTHAISWFSVQTQLELAKTHLAVSDVKGASTLYHEADEILRRRPRLGTLVDQAEDVRTQLTSVGEQASGWASTLTAAELRLLPLLTTHLSFREIAERLFVSRNTVKTQAISVYRKLDASSRSEAIERAVELGLVDASPAAAAQDG